MPTDLQDLLGIFLEEVRDLCRQAAKSVLELEQGTAGDGAEQQVAALARALHSIKGSGATLGVDDVARLAHALEDLIAPLRRDGERLDAASADALLRYLDVIMQRMEAHAQGRGAELTDVGPDVDELRRLASTDRPARPAKDGAGTSASAAAQSSVAHTAPRSAIRADGSNEARAAANDEDAWRVSPQKISALIREVERLREARLRASEQWRAVSSATRQLAGARPEIREALATVARGMRGEADELGSIIEGLESEIRSICTVPVAVILEPLHRTVRDVCRQSGKEARLSIVGGELELDRRLVQALRGPLVHLVRNAVDHGLESPEERRALGKHAEGALVLRVELQGNMVFVEIADDGSGIDLERVRQTALAHGLIDEAAAAAMSDAELQQLIFRPGFSTRTEVTDTSGRGVGLDLVRAEVQALRGVLEVESRRAQGTRFLLTLPTDLGSSFVLVVRCGEQLFGIPMHAVEAVVRTRRTSLRVGRHEIWLVDDDRSLPLRDLAAELRIRSPEVPEEGRPLVIVQREAHTVALSVDEVVGDRELLVHPLPSGVCPEPAYRGAAAMAQGELMLVLQPQWLVHSSNSTAEPVGATSRALVVDDSLTARAMHRAILEAGGFTVHAVGSAARALDQLRHSAYAIVVCDVSMPDMDGLAFARELRRRTDTAQLPLILVSGQDDASAREQALSAGADAFLGKRECASGRLLAEVSDVIARRRGAA